METSTVGTQKGLPAQPSTGTGTGAGTVTGGEKLSPWRVSIIASMGSAVEYFDFALYGVLAVMMSGHFFPTTDGLDALLGTLGIFASAFFVRPLGGVFFGWLGDRFGRKKTLLTTVLGMGAASACVGLLPTYATAGIWAPILLLVCRVIQGFFAGGEVSGAVTYIAEVAPANRRGMFGSFNPAGVGIGTGSAALVAGIVGLVLGADDMREWGWRIPFLLCFPLILLTVWARQHLEESPKFKSAQKSQAPEKAPLSDVISNHGKSLFRVVVIATAQNACAYLGLVYFNIHLTKVMNYPSQMVYWLMAAGPILSALLMPFFGRLSDSVGRRPVLIAGYVAYVVFTPLALWMTSQGDFNLAIAAVLLEFFAFAMVQAVGYPLYGELFPTHVRYTGVSVGFNLGAILGGASTPYISTWLVQQTGDKTSPAYFVMATAVCALIVFFTMRETAQDNLED